MDVFDLVAKLSLDDSEAEKGLSGFAGKAGSLLGGAAKAAAGAMAAATTAVVGFTGEAVKVGASFDSSMSQVAATMGKTVDEIGELRDFAQEMGSTTSFSATQAADALNYMALAGYDAETSMSMLPNVLNLAAAGGIELAEASDMVTDAASALGMTLEDGSVDIQQVTEMIDGMAVASSKSNTSVEQLGSAILTVGGTAKNMAGGTTELSAALGILADNGIKGAEGGTALRNVLLSMQGGKFEEVFGAVGVSAYDANGNLREMKDILADMNSVMDGMTDEEKTSYITKTFNKADLKSINALLATSTDRWDELSSAIDDSAGAAEKMADTQLDNLQGDITLLQSAWEGFQIAVSDKVTPALREFVQFGSDGLSRLTEAFKTGGIEGAFGELGNILQEGIGKITKVLPQITSVATQLIQSLLQGITDNLPAIGSAAIQIITQLGAMIIESLPLLISAGLEIIMQLSQAVIDNLPMIVETAIQIITQISQFLVDNADQLLGAGIQIILTLSQAILDNLPQLLETGLQLIMQIVQAIFTNLPLLVNAASQIVMGIANFITENLSMIIDAGISILLALIDAIIETLPDLVDQIVEVVVAIAETIISNLDKILAAGVQIIVTLALAIIKSLPKILDAGKRIILSLINGINSIKSQLFQKISEIITYIINKIAELPGKMLTYGAQIIQNLAQGIANTVSSITNAMSSIGTTIYNGIKGTIDKAKEWGTHLIQNFIAGLNAAWKNNPINKIAQGIADKLAHSHPKEGPLADDYTWMPDMMDLFTEGIKSKQGQLFKTIDDTFNFGERVTIPTESAFGASSTTSYGVPEKNVTVILQLDKTQLGKTVFTLNNEESRRIGVSLVNA